MDDATNEVAIRVSTVVAEAAGGAIREGRAELSITRLADLYAGDWEYDCPVVVLSPRNPDAARLVVEVQGDEVWWVTTADGPGTELSASTANRDALLAALVRATVAGRYSHGPRSERVKGLPRSREVHVWVETFLTEDGPFTSEHYGRDVPDEERHFAAY